MIFIGVDCRMLVESCKIKPAFTQSTDHLSVFLKLRSGVQEKGSGFWKINNSILQELEYQTLINHLIDRQGTHLTAPSGVSKHFRYPPIINDTGLNISIHCFNPIYKRIIKTKTFQS
jgi:hypothetical protein